MKDAVAVLSKDNHLVPHLLQEPKPPADRLTRGAFLLTLQPVRRGQGEQQQGEHDMDPHRSGQIGPFVRARCRLTAPR